MSGVIDAYLEHRAGEVSGGTVITERYRLKAITNVVERDRLLSAVTPAIAGELYTARGAAAKADTHRGELAVVKAMFAWCVGKGWLRANPFEKVEPTGKKAVRRDHLRIDETRAFIDAAKSDATDAGLAAAIAVLFGLRASEVVGILVRDVDDGARVLWVDGTKSEAARRSFRIELEWLRRRLARMTKGRASDERLFGSVTRRWLSYHVARLCELAGVQEVSPHALRRTFSAIGGEHHSIAAVSEAMGQAGVAINRRHYQPTNAEERRTSSAVLRSLNGGRS